MTPEQAKRAVDNLIKLYAEQHQVNITKKEKATSN
jgi:hypothetical protein